MEITVKGMNYTIGGGDNIAGKYDMPVLFVRRGGKTVKVGYFNTKEDMLNFFDVLNEMGLVATDETTKAKIAKQNHI